MDLAEIVTKKSDFSYFLINKYIDKSFQFYF